MYESITLSLTGNDTTLSANYFPSLNVNEDSEIALICLQTFNSFPNINSTNNRLEIEVIGDTDNRFIENAKFVYEFEEGYYDIDDINNKIGKELLTFNKLKRTYLSFSMIMDHIDFRTHIRCDGRLYFDIPNSIGSVLGFEKKKYFSRDDLHRSEKAVNLNTINCIKVLCNVSQGSFNNHLQSHSIYEFFPTGRTGTKVTQSPLNLIYYKLNKINIDSITIQLVDQNNKPIDNFNETLTVVLHIKRHGS